MLNEGVAVVFQVTEGYPDYTVTWSKDGSLLKTNNSRYTFSPDQLILTIYPLSYDDEGQYNVTVVNEAGSDSAVVSLSVEGME